MRKICRVKIKTAPEGRPHPIRLTAFEVNPNTPRDALGKCHSADDQERNYTEESRRRAAEKAWDYMFCTDDLKWFVTLTLDAEKITRDDYAQIVNKFGQWADNRVRRKGLAYVVVPEFHKDGKTIHFHGLFNDALEMRKTAIKRRGKRVYNVADWSFGFSTAQRITGENGREKAVAYVMKYMHKAGEKIGGRWYLHGGALKQPEVIWGSVEWDEVPCEPIEIYGGAKAKVIRDESTILGLTTLFHVTEEGEVIQGL